MSDDIKNILFNGASSEENNSNRIRKYLKDEMTDAERHALEKHLLDDTFEREALEGLESIKDDIQLDLHIYQLQKSLKEKTALKKERFSKRMIKPQWWLFFSVLLLLILIVMIYLYMHRMR